MEQLMRRPGGQGIALPTKQRGVVVFISLIVLVVMTLAALGLVRSIDTATLVAGNLAFKQASLHLADIGTEAAVNELERFATTSADAPSPSGCSSNGACRYFPVMQTLDSRGVPSVANWSNVAYTRDISFPSTFNGNSSIPSGYNVQFVVERLCSGTLPITDPSANCYAKQSSEGEGGSKKSGSPKFTSVAKLYYRATIRVSDARGAETITQVILQR